MENSAFKYNDQIYWDYDIPHITILNRMINVYELFDYDDIDRLVDDEELVYGYYENNEFIPDYKRKD